jgi:hypothetical protein
MCTRFNLKKFPSTYCNDFLSDDVDEPSPGSSQIFTSLLRGHYTHTHSGEEGKQGRELFVVRNNWILEREKCPLEMSSLQCMGTRRHTKLSEKNICNLYDLFMHTSFRTTLNNNNRLIPINTRLFRTQIQFSNAEIFIVVMLTRTLSMLTQ